MIDQTNFETWFLMYADNELSAAEKLQVDEFVHQHPSFKKQFDIINQIRFQPTDIQFPDKSILYSDQMEEAEMRFVPDESIVFPGKETLYRQAKTRKIGWHIPIGIAASVILFLGLFSLLNTQKEVQQSKGVSKVVKQSPILNSTDSVEPVEQEIVQAREVPVVNKKNDKVIVENILPIPITEVIATQSIDNIETAAVETLPQTVSSNFSPDALKAAELRNAVALIPEVNPVTINAAMIIEASNRKDEHSKLRGIARKITRQLFRQEEQPEATHYIQVASFNIPVANKK
jgi:hypothetical protein